MRPPRAIPRFVSAFPPPLNKNVLTCSGSVRSEILGAIKLYSEVNEFGRELLRANGHAKPAKAFPRFQAYIRQANTFFEAAEVLHPRASPLNYYYAFMNFAKALLLLKDPKFVDQRLKHGLAPNSSGGSLRRQFLHVARKGVYPLFYRHVTGKMPKPQLRMKVVDLLSYCTDVGFEFDKLKYGPRRLFPCRLAIGVNGNIAFPVIAVGIGGGVHKFKAIMKHMEKHFDQVDFGEANARGVFDMLTNERRAHFFYESKAEYPFAQAPNALTTQQIVEKTLSELPGPSLNPFNDDFLFMLNCPLTSRINDEMRDILAIYCCMFHLGSLVRYRPDVLEGMLSTRDSWIIERFTVSAPVTFLRHWRNLLDGEYLVYTAR